jgi:hypothetical protein
MADTNRVALTVRMRPDHKIVFSQAAENAGLEPGTAARQVLELIAGRLKEDGDFLQALLEMKAAWREAKAA